MQRNDLKTVKKANYEMMMAETQRLLDIIEKKQMEIILKKLAEKNANTKTKCYGNKNDYYKLFSTSDKLYPVNLKENQTFTAIGNNKL